MQKNLYFEIMFRRRNVIMEALLNFFFSFSSWPRLLLEVFVRRDFGQRYFSFSGAIIITVILGLYPVGNSVGMDYFLTNGRYGYRIDFVDFMVDYLTWYGFLVYFMYAAIQRRDEIVRLPSTFDFARFSLSTGLIDPRFKKVQIGGKRADVRTISTLLEPGFFFLIGLALWLILGQPLGVLLVISSVFYSLSYVASHHQADNLLLDKIDERIVSEEWGRAFIEGLDASETRGFSVIGRRPADPAARRLVAEMYKVNEEIFEAL